jgi:hypothetical protein
MVDDRTSGGRADRPSPRTGTLPPRLNALHNQDCIAGLGRLDDGAVDLAFADPLDGAAEPLLSAPSTAAGRRLENVAE